MCDSARILVLYATQTFTAQEMAERIWRSLKILGFRGPVQAMDDYPISKLIHEEFALFVCATTGQGDEPDNMKKFWKFLLRKNLPSNSLIKLKYGVLGLGDSSYTKFNFVGKKLHKRLMQLGATPLLDIGLCDYQHDLGHDAVMKPWVENFYSILKRFYPDIKTDNLVNKFVPRWKVSLIRDDQTLVTSCMSKDIYYANGNVDNFLDTTLFELESNVRTTDESHFQDVRLMTFKTVNSVLNYKPGDVFNIRPRNRKEDIDELFNIFQLHDIDIKPNFRLLVEELHEDMPVPDFLHTPLTLYEIAEQYWDLRAYPTQYVFSLLALVSRDKLEKDKCRELSSPEGQEDWLNYCRRPKRTILEVLHDFHKSASELSIDILFELFSTIKPRSFSIASSCLPSSGRNVELLVAVVKYYTNLKKVRLGLCSNWLAGLNPGDKVYAWIKKGTFVFPQDKNIPNILIGPGTGLAPFRSLLQECDIQDTLNKQTMHLFFGCRYKDKDYHCRNELEMLVANGKLSLYCAFSRDQEEKIYVQHKIIEYKNDLWCLINTEKASIFLSGNAKNMPDNVREAIVEVIASGGHSTEDAKEILKNMERDGRFQTETW
ncbi:NADPH-dependent diflavin oxidoreductase 1 [Galleria mellonella]|uniref:NADPH-dependent diflavin oxidoreductase 1 n=1 Tax=Galleria mellonella TaxID=7137 RepID=A0A6J1WI75_GALME|nr:NADPH-dependent diflavin oxidoreductase 1 [Galleria mellonella]